MDKALATTVVIGILILSFCGLILGVVYGGIGVLQARNGKATATAIMSEIDVVNALQNGRHDYDTGDFCGAGQIFDSVVPFLNDRISNGINIPSQIQPPFEQYPFYAAVSNAMLLYSGVTECNKIPVEPMTTKPKIKNYYDMVTIWIKKLDAGDSSTRIAILLRQLCDDPHKGQAYYNALYQALEQPVGTCVSSLTMTPTAQGRGYPPATAYTPLPTSSQTFTPAPSPTATAIPTPYRPPSITGASFYILPNNSNALLVVNVNVQNNSGDTIPPQAPASGYMYEEGDSYKSQFPEIKGGFRVGIDFDGRSGVDHPYRWGLVQPLAPGQSTTITGMVLLKKTQSSYYWAGLVQEGITWIVDGQGKQLISVTLQPSRIVQFDRISPAECSQREIDFTELRMLAGGLMQVSGTATTSDPSSSNPDVAFLRYELSARLSDRGDYSVIGGYNRPVLSGVLTRGDGGPNPIDWKQLGYQSGQSINLAIKVYRKNGNYTKNDGCVVRFILP